MDLISYRSLDRYKYQLLEVYQHETIWTGRDGQRRLTTQGGWVTLRTDGMLCIKNGYCWDGPSGPAMDTKSAMRGSLVHDACYQLMREKIIGISHREPVDRLYVDICQEDGMSSFRARYQYWGIHWFAKSAAVSDKPEIEVLTAP